MFEKYSVTIGYTEDHLHMDRNLSYSPYLDGFYSVFNLRSTNHFPTFREKPPELLDSSEIVSMKFNLGDRSFKELLTKKYGNNLINKINRPTNSVVYNYNGVNEAYAFFDNYKGRPRFNVYAEGALNAQGSGVVFMEGQWQGADAIINLARHALNQMPFSSIRILASYSGNGKVDSLIHKVSRALQMPSKGYIGLFVAIDAHFRENLLSDLGSPLTPETTVKSTLLGRVKIVLPVEGVAHTYTTGVVAAIAGAEMFYIKK